MAIKSPKLTPAQERVLYWLWAHPTVTINLYAGDARINRSNWSHYWRDGAAFAEMRRVASALNGGYIEAPRRAPAEGGTPRLTTQIFAKLRERGLISVVRHRPRGNCMCECWRYSISNAGKAAINRDES
jgi:hypothetical protein